MDRDILLFEKMNEINDNKISFMIESLDNQLKISMLEAQYKVITENGTKEDFKYLYMEAQEETKEKKKNIFSAIKKLLADNINKLMEFLQKKKLKMEIKALPENCLAAKVIIKAKEGFKKFHQWLIKPIKLIKEKKYKELTMDLVSKGSIILSAILTFKAIKDVRDARVECAKMRQTDVVDAYDWIYKDFVKDGKDAVTALSVYDDISISDAPDSGIIKIIKEIISHINKAITAAMDWISTLISNIKKMTKNENNTNTTPTLGSNSIKELPSGSTSYKPLPSGSGSFKGLPSGY